MTINRFKLALAALMAVAIVGCGKSEDAQPLPDSPGAERLKTEGGDNAPKKAEGAASAEGL